MNLLERIRSLFAPKKKADAQPEVIPEKPVRMERPCKTCGKMIPYYTSWKHLPNYCPECKRAWRAEHSAKWAPPATDTTAPIAPATPPAAAPDAPAADPPTRLSRKCKRCGRPFSFSSTLIHYPNYCTTCRAIFRRMNS